MKKKSKWQQLVYDEMGKLEKKGVKDPLHVALKIAKAKYKKPKK